MIISENLNYRELNFGKLPSIGQYIKGSHWEDKPLIQRIKDVVKFIFKLLVVSVVIGSIAGACIPPFSFALALVVASIVTFFGLIKLSIDLDKLHNIQSSLDKSDNNLGEWSDNSIMVTESGAESMEMKFKLVENARESIEISGSYCGGEIFDQFLNLIDKKMNENPNLKVKIISNKSLLTKSNLNKIAILQKKYANFFVLVTSMKFIHIPSLRSLENHTKLLIVDGTYAMTGGTGIQDLLSREGSNSQELSFKESILGVGARDMDVVITGPISKVMLRQYYHLLSKWKKLTSKRNIYGVWDNEYVSTKELSKAEILERNKFIFEGRIHRNIEQVKAAFAVGSYEHGKTNGCTQAFLKMIKSAKKTIVLANMNFSDPIIINELKKAALNGIKIKIITNINHPYSSIAARILGHVNKSLLTCLMDVGAECYGYSKTLTLYHKKVMVIDDQITTMGSCNISSHMKSQDENVIVMDSAEVAQKILTVLKEDEDSSVKLVKPSLLSRVYTKFVATLCNVVTKNIYQ